jgi:hypothetical protein
MACASPSYRSSTVPSAADADFATYNPGALLALGSHFVLLILDGGLYRPGRNKKSRGPRTAALLRGVHRVPAAACVKPRFCRGVAQ